MRKCCGQSPAHTKHLTESNDTYQNPDRALIKYPSIPNIWLEILRILFDDLWVTSRTNVMKEIAHLNGPKSFEMGTMRIAFLVRKCVVLPMHGHPLPRHNTGSHPNEEAKHPLHNWIEHQRAMCSRSM